MANTVLDLFNLTAAPKQSKDSLKIESSSTASKSALVSETALQIDDWSVRRGNEVLEQSERLQASKLDGNSIADFVAAGFEPEPILAESCSDSLRHEFVKQLLDTPEYHELHAMTQGDTLSSEIAASHFAEQFCVLREQRELREKREKKAGKKTGKTPKDESIDSELEAIRAVGRALAGAKKECDEASDAAQAFGLGEGANGKGDAAAIARIFNRVRNSDSLKRICELAGKFRRLARSKQRQKTKIGFDDVTGIGLGSELGRLVPAELLRLCDPDLELDLFRRIIEAQAMVVEYKGIKNVGLGPVIFVVDESGSMHGEKVALAKAVALAMAFIAKTQNRWCALVAYSGGRDGRRLVLPPNNWDSEQLADWLSAFLGGGTSLDCPLSELPQVYWPEFVSQGLQRGKTDLVFVTDCIVEAPQDVVDKFNHWRQAEQVRTQVIVINGEAGDMSKISDEVHLVNSISFEDEAIGKVLSI